MFNAIGNGLNIKSRRIDYPYGACPLPDSDSYSDSYTNSYEVNKGSTRTDSDGDYYSDSYGQLLWKLLKFYLIGTDIGAKLATVAIGIRIGITIGIGLGSVETVLHIIIESNFIGIGVGIGVGQWKHTIRGTRFLNVNYCLKSHNAHTKHRERLVFAFADCIDIFVKDFFSPWQVKLVDIVPELTLLRRSRSPEVKNSFFSFA